tara:strand:+ start:339 stop:491 length:153 start_codon:yes stop_codon:yes gene_type:complete
MIDNILNSLELLKNEKEIGECTFIALGKNKAPTGLIEAYKQLKRERCQKK